MGNNEQQKIKINLENILSFVEGNFKFYLNKLVNAEEHLREQYIYRFKKCKNDCVKTGKCKYCGCPVDKKHTVVKSCNNGEIFPDLMGKDDWTKFKINNKIKL